MIKKKLEYVTLARSCAMRDSPGGPLLERTAHRILDGYPLCTELLSVLTLRPELRSLVHGTENETAKNDRFHWRSPLKAHGTVIEPCRASFRTSTKRNTVRLTTPRFVFRAVKTEDGVERWTVRYNQRSSASTTSRGASGDVNIFSFSRN